MNRDIEGLRRGRVWLPIALAGCLVLGIATASSGVVITFTGGQASSASSPGGIFVPNNLGYVSDCTQYTEGGMRISFVGFMGIIGDYYSVGAGGFVGNDVIHAHWAGSTTSIIFSKIDGTPFDLTYFDVTSNTQIGGGQSTGNELSYITSSKGQMLLPPSDWGFAFDVSGQPGDGIQRLWPNANFLGINSFTVTSQNAYCFGLDNFYIDQPAPPDPTVPEPLTGLVVAMSLIPLGSKAIRRVRGA